MTAYALNGTPPLGGGSTVGGFMGLKAGIYSIRINSVHYTIFHYYPDTNTFAISWYVNRVAGATMSGGSAMIPTPLRSGAPAASATAAQNGSVTFSGTVVTLQTLGTGGSGYGSDTQIYQPPLDVTLRPGEAFYTNGWVGNATATPTYAILPTIYFEELRLDWAA